MDAAESTSRPEQMQFDAECRLPDLAVDEQDLVARMRRGEQHAFDRFFEAYAPRLARFAARRSSLDDAAIEDVVQVSMIKAIRGLENFRGGSSLLTWLCQICRNHLFDLRRQAGRQPATQSLEQLKVFSPSGTLAALTDSRDLLDECVADATCSAVRRMVNRLPVSYAQILELRYGQDLTVPEIARLLRVSERAAESRLVRARQAFRDGWDGEANKAALRQELPVSRPAP